MTDNTIETRKSWNVEGWGHLDFNEPVTYEYALDCAEKIKATMWEKGNK